MGIGPLPVLCAMLVAVVLRIALVRLPEIDLKGPEPIICDIHDSDSAVLRFSQLLQFPSVSRLDAAVHIRDDTKSTFDDMITHLSSAYSAAWSAMEVEMVGAGNYTTLLTWRGKDPSLLPLLFISHYDVVPVTEGTEHEWLHGPFSGAVQDGYIWGRGTLDIKFCVAALLEAFSQLIKEGYTPDRTIYVAFGHDEEVGGGLGAARVAQLLESRGIQLEVVVDEGGTILKDGIRPFTSDAVAMVGTSEKVYTTVEVNLTSSGGHSSMPPTDGTDIATQMAKLLTYVRGHPFSPSLREPVAGFLRSLAPYTSNRLLQYLLLNCGKWPLRWIIPQAFVLASPETAAMVRTTVAVTRMEAGVADNVLPQHGCMRFNMRSHPEDSRDEILEYFNVAMKKAGVSGTARIHEATHFGPRPGVTTHEGPHFQAVKQAIQEVWRHDDKAIAVVPFLMTGGTDSKHYAGLTKHGILRFVPYMLNKTAGDLSRIHGTNERVPVEDFQRAICTYRRIVQLLSGSLEH